MRQYLDVKRQHRDAIVFFRMGDFYEMFYEDALTASRVLELTLTSRAKDPRGATIPMCGVPFHAADTYLARLIRKGYRVAICDQVEDPKTAKGLVKRAVTRVVSPGTFTDAAYLDAREPAFLAAVRPAASADDRWGLAFLDVSTGEFAAAEFGGAGAAAAVAAELAMLRPRELLAAEDADIAAVLASMATGCTDGRWSRRGRVRRSARSCRRRRSRASASTTRPPRWERPAASSPTSTTPSAPTSRTSGASRFARPLTPF
jgi:DNA mismatch repair protein MutS